MAQGFFYSGKLYIYIHILCVKAQMRDEHKNTLVHQHSSKKRHLRRQAINLTLSKQGDNQGSCQSHLPDKNVKLPDTHVRWPWPKEHKDHTKTKPCTNKHGRSGIESRQSSQSQTVFLVAQIGSIWKARDVILTLETESGNLPSGRQLSINGMLVIFWCLRQYTYGTGLLKKKKTHGKN